MYVDKHPPDLRGAEISSARNLVQSWRAQDTGGELETREMETWVLIGRLGLFVYMPNLKISKVPKFEVAKLFVRLIAMALLPSGKAMYLNFDIATSLLSIFTSRHHSALTLSHVYVPKATLNHTSTYELWTIGYQVFIFKAPVEVKEMD